MTKTTAELAAQARYRASEKGRAVQQVAQKRYYESEKGRAAQARAIERRRVRRLEERIASYSPALTAEVDG